MTVAHASFVLFIKLGEMDCGGLPRYMAAVPPNSEVGFLHKVPYSFFIWGLKNLIGQYGVLHPLHPQCGCSSVKMCEQRTWTVCCFLLGPKPVTLESIGYQP